MRFELLLFLGSFIEGTSFTSICCRDQFPVLLAEAILPKRYHVSKCSMKSGKLWCIFHSAVLPNPSTEWCAMVDLPIYSFQLFCLLT